MRGGLFSEQIENLDLAEIVGKSSRDVRSVALICFWLGCIGSVTVEASMAIGHADP